MCLPVGSSQSCFNCVHSNSTREDLHDPWCMEVTDTTDTVPESKIYRNCTGECMVSADHVVQTMSCRLHRPCRPERADKVQT